MWPLRTYVLTLQFRYIFKESKIEGVTALMQLPSDTRGFAFIFFSWYGFCWIGWLKRQIPHSITTLFFFIFHFLTRIMRDLLSRHNHNSGYNEYLQPCQGDRSSKTPFLHCNETTCDEEGRNRSTTYTTTPPSMATFALGCDAVYHYTYWLAKCLFWHMNMAAAHCAIDFW